MVDNAQASGFSNSLCSRGSYLLKRMGTGIRYNYPFRSRWAMETVVGLPDVFAEIFEHLNPATLLRCALVCTSWYVWAVKRLWRGSVDYDEWVTPSLEEMEKCGIPTSRYQYYLQYTRFYIIHLGGKRAPQPARDFRELVLSGCLTAPKAEFLLVDISTEIMNESTMIPLLVPSLRSLQLYGGLYTSKFLDELTTRSPMLQSLLLDNRSDEMQPKDVVKFLDAMPQLTSIELAISEISEPLILALLSRANLACIHLGGAALLNSRVVRTLSAMDGPYAAMSLRSFTVDVADGDALRSFLPKLRNLQAVCLGKLQKIESPGPDVILPLSSCPELSELDLSISSRAEILLEDLICLARSCSRLKRICVNLSDDNDGDQTNALNFREHSWGMLTSNLKSIECLELECKVDIGCEEFSRLAYDCPNLVRLELDTQLNAFDLRQVHPRPHFPSLEVLRLTAVARFRGLRSAAAVEYTAYRVYNVLREHMPRLTEFWATRFLPVHGPVKDGHIAISEAFLDADISIQHPNRMSKSIRGILIEESLTGR